MTALPEDAAARLGAALDALDAADRARALAEAEALTRRADAPSRAAGARLQALLRDYEGALRALEGGGGELARLRYALLKRLRFEVEASEALAEVLAERPDARARMAAALHEESAGRFDRALAHLDALARDGADPARYAWLRARLGAALDDRRVVEEAARVAPTLDADATGELVAALLEVGAFDAAAAHGGDAVRARLALFRGATDEALALAERAGADDVAFAALVHAGRLARARERLAALDGRDDPTLDVWRATLALAEGDVAGAAPWLVAARDRVPDYLAAELLWVIVDGARRPVPHVERFAYEGLLEGQLAALGVAPPRDAEGRIARAALEAAAREGLARLGGNRTPLATRCDDGVLTRVRVPASPRHRARRAQHTAPFAGIDGARRAVDAVLSELGAHPVAACYRVELDLWAGDYARAADGFQAILAARQKTVWAWIGLAAAQLHLGEPARALATLDAGVALIGCRGVTVPVTRGEILLALGRHDEAEAELAQARRAQPGRVAAWALSVVCADARGDADARARRFARLERDAPALVADAARAAGVGGWWPAPPSPAQQLASARAALALMRGNRSSSCALWHAPRTGVVRAHVPGRPATTPAWEADERRALARLAGRR
ncbi:MAG: hypothetical protein KF729_08255 [Sandaracinaceae bacterium]|nr:hypothetical protein [Sandaracinaceae bacterium]